MSRSENHESMLWAVLAKERLVDLSQFHKSGFFDEVPLFSRDSDIDFLSDRPCDTVNGILLDFALKFLKAVVSYEEHRSQFVAAIAVWRPVEDDRVVPNLFVWCGSAHRLRSKLFLGPPTTPFARKLKRLVSTKHPRDGFEVLEDTTTQPSETRVFISLCERPYSGFVLLREFFKIQSPHQVDLQAATCRHADCSGSAGSRGKHAAQHRRAPRCVQPRMGQLRLWGSGRPGQLPTQVYPDPGSLV